MVAAASALHGHGVVPATASEDASQEVGLIKNLSLWLRHVLEVLRPVSHRTLASGIIGRLGPAGAPRLRAASLPHKM